MEWGREGGDGEPSLNLIPKKYNPKKVKKVSGFPLCECVSVCLSASLSLFLGRRFESIQTFPPLALVPSATLLCWILFSFASLYSSFRNSLRAFPEHFPSIFRAFSRHFPGRRLIKQDKYQTECIVSPYNDSTERLNRQRRGAGKQGKIIFSAWISYLLLNSLFRNINVQ